MIYFDNAATTRVSRAVLQEMNHAFIELYANPSSSHKAGLQAKDLVQKAREQCATPSGHIQNKSCLPPEAPSPTTWLFLAWQGH